MIEMPPTALSDDIRDDGWTQSHGQSTPAARLNSLLAGFVRDIPGVSDVLAVSPDGLVIACSGGLPDDRVDQLGAITGGLASLSGSATWCLSGAQVRRTVIDMAHGTLLVLAVPAAGHLAVLTSAGCDLEDVYDGAVVLTRRLTAALMMD